MSRLTENLRLLKRMNWGMTIAVGILLVIGVLFVYSSCYVSEEMPVKSLYKRQIMWVLVGIACYIGAAAVDYRRMRDFAWPAYIVCMLLLVIVLFTGPRIYGARRWLLLFGRKFQPSELAKLATIVLLARRLSRPGIDLGNAKTIAFVLLLVAIPFVLILKEPDLGTAMVFLPTAFVMMFVAGVPLRVLGSLVLVGVLGISFLVGAMFLPERLGVSEEGQERVWSMTGLSDYQRGRIMVFFNADADPLGAGWNKMQSEIAVGSGGVWGKGFLKGTQNILGFLPRKVAPTDFIYSVIAEEKGFVGSVLVLFLFASVIAFGLQAAIAVRGRLGRLLCVGVVAMVFSHVFVNIAMTVGLMPITGLPLPLLSYGGSFMVVVMSALGIVQSVQIRARLQERRID